MLNVVKKITQIFTTNKNDELKKLKKCQISDEVFNPVNEWNIFNLS